MRWINAACMFVVGFTVAVAGIGFGDLAYWVIVGAAAVPAALQEVAP